MVGADLRQRRPQLLLVLPLLLVLQLRVAFTAVLGWLQILTFIMFMEVIGILNSRRPTVEPGYTCTRS